MTLWMEAAKSSAGARLVDFIRWRWLGVSMAQKSVTTLRSGPMCRYYFAPMILLEMHFMFRSPGQSDTSSREANARLDATPFNLLRCAVRHPSQCSHIPVCTDWLPVALF